MALSKQQQKIIDCDLNTDVLVNAGAGSGKTFVLKNKIATHLANGDIEPSQLLVLTFTNNAAHDMKVQIIDEVNKLQPKDAKDKARIEEIKNAINSAHIQTFDSFAQEIVKAYAYTLNKPNTVFIANEFVLQAKKIQLLEQIINNKYEIEDKDFIDLIASYNLRDDKKTKAVILDLYEKLDKYTPIIRKELIDKFLSLQDKDQFNLWAKEYKDLFAQRLVVKANSLKTESKRNKALEEIPQKVAEEVGDLDKEYEMYSSTFKHVKTLINICAELDKAIVDYKKQSNTYTFGDVALMALDILHNEEIAEVIRSNFKYIMIDEYQDTNDIQEEVINILLKPKKDGTRNHLFAVGDPKQSIYGFRNANLDIFLNREKEFKKAKGAKVIYMNQTFRSHPVVIKDINTIFKKYMTPEHGGIDYLEEGQQLELAESNNARQWDGYGLNIITTDNQEDLTNSKSSNIKQWEVRAIIQDINKKIHDKVQVYDKKTGKSRDITFKDFYILVRTKANYALYEREFINAGIPLNNTIASNLAEVNAVMLITSFVKLFAIFDSHKDDLATLEQEKHIFASLARSYVFRDTYNDQEIIELIKDDSFTKTELWESVVNLYATCNGATFTLALMAIITTFRITDNLYKIGEIEKNAAKIESLIQLVSSIEESGGQIKDFAELLDIISKNYIDLKDESVVDLENAVSLMTIHQSKGLQNKIVYLPNSVNHLGGMSYMDKPDYDFSEEHGILLPVYDFDNYRNAEENADEYPKGASIWTLPYKLFRLKRTVNQEEIDEHVRLFYVALTRAEQGIYIVGYPKCKLVKYKGVDEDSEGPNGFELNDSTKETLFHMLSFVWENHKWFPFDSKFFPKGKWEFISLPEPKEAYKRPLAITHVNDDYLEFEEIKKQTASQLDCPFKDEEIEALITKGDELHAIMEAIDYENPNLDFITNRSYNATVSDVLNMDIFKKTLKGASFYTEYQYFDPKTQTNGFIDLLAIKDNTYYIIDFKYSNIDKPEYNIQLKTYRKNIARIFNIDNSQIKTLLISLEKQKIREVK